MKKIQITTSCRRILADVFTPVGIYMRLRDRFRDTILLESTDHHASENSWSFIGVNAIAGIELMNTAILEYKLPARKPERIAIEKLQDVPAMIGDFIQRFEWEIDACKEARFAQGLYGYTTYDAVRCFESVQLQHHPETGVGLLRYRLYQYVIAINHYKDELHICENRVEGIDSELALLESVIRSKDIPVFPFAAIGQETSNLTDAAFLNMVQKGIASCMRGDVFQIVLSRRFQQPFSGDEFNVYRALRSINPSPYLFFFDYGDYKLLGSSPESQLIVRNGKAVVHPIAGTFRRTGDDASDQAAAGRLLADAKENAEHVMLVDLARNDLSRVCTAVQVAQYRQVQYYSHVIHLVSEVTGTVEPGTNPYHLLAQTFPAGTLSGAPKIKAMQLIDNNEPDARGYYGGAIGFLGSDGSCNHAIMIRTFLSRNNTLFYQAGAGVVAASNPENELQEVNNKLGALKKAIVAAEVIA